MKLYIIAFLTLISLGLFVFQYQAQTENLESNGFLTYKIAIASGPNKGKVLARTQQSSSLGEATALVSNSDVESEQFQQVFIGLPKGDTDNTYRFVMVGDKGESLALTAYDSTQNVYVRVNLIEDKLDKWWTVNQNGNTATIENIASDLKNTWLCGAQVESSDSGADCTWELIQADLPL